MLVPHSIVKSRRSRRMTIAHRFIGGCKGEYFYESVKRTTTDDKPNANKLSVVRFTDLIVSRSRCPALKRWATFTQSASRTRGESLLQQRPTASISVGILSIRLYHPLSQQRFFACC